MSLMELKKLGNGNSSTEWKKILNIVRTRKTTLFASGFGFTLLVCSILLVVTNPSPLNQRQSWIPSMFGGSSSRSRTFFTFFFPNSHNSSEAENSPVQDPGREPHESVVDNMNGIRNTSGAQENPSDREHHESVVDTMNGISNTSGAQESASDISSSRDFLDSGGKVDKTIQDPHKYPDGSLVGTMPDNAKDSNRTQERENPFAGSVPINSSDPDFVKRTTSPASAQIKPLEAISSNSSGEPVFGSNVTEAKGTEISNGTTSQETEKEKKCDIYNGRWVPDPTKPLYPAGSCPHIDESFSCFLNRRPDHDYEKWRWQPNDCDIPRFNATDMLERLRGKRLSYVGDSLNRNMWESMVCSLRHVVPDKKKVHEISGKKEFRAEGFYSFRYEDYNCSVDFIRAPFLVQEWEVDDGNGSKKETLRLDRMDTSASKYKDADIIVFNTGHWWTHEKTSKGKDYYQEGDHIYPELNVLEAYRKALKTWAKWVDRHINPNRTLVYFRGYSSTHFSGGQWNSGGQCHKESEPIYNETYLTKYNPKMLVLESVMQEMKTPVNYLNITRITDYRKDAHPSIYRKQYLSQEERIQSTQYQDCSHWCLPGVPDTWNELLYASLLLTGKGTWAT